jgi:hypothetical protein
MCALESCMPSIAGPASGLSRSTNCESTTKSTKDTKFNSEELTSLYVGKSSGRHSLSCRFFVVFVSFVVARTLELTLMGFRRDDEPSISDA